jgi:hypothetical protein
MRANILLIILDATRAKKPQLLRIQTQYYTFFDRVLDSSYPLSTGTLGRHP